MTHVFETKFAIRGNEIGTTGEVPLGTYARYAEWARWSIFLDDRAAALKAAFQTGVVRAQTYEILAPITYPDDLVVETWLSRVGRTSLDFGQALRSEAGVRFAEARVTLVQIGPNGPVAFPDWLKDHVVPRATVEPLPLLTAAPEGPVYVHDWRVRTSDLDQFHHVNQAKYVDHVDDTRSFAHADGHSAGFEGRVKKVSLTYDREMRTPDRVMAHLSRRADGLRDVVIVGADGRIANRTVLEPT